MFFKKFSLSFLHSSRAREKDREVFIQTSSSSLESPNSANQSQKQEGIHYILFISPAARHTNTVINTLPSPPASNVFFKYTCVSSLVFSVHFGLSHVWCSGEMSTEADPFTHHPCKGYCYVVARFF